MPASSAAMPSKGHSVWMCSGAYQRCCALWEGNQTCTETNPFARACSVVRVHDPHLHIKDLPSLQRTTETAGDAYAYHSHFFSSRNWVTDMHSMCRVLISNNVIIIRIRDTLLVYYSYTQVTMCWENLLTMHKVCNLKICLFKIIMQSDSNHWLIQTMFSVLLGWIISGLQIVLI